MNASLALSTLAFAPTYDLFSFAPRTVDIASPTPSGTFVDGLVAALASSFALDADEQELALLLLFGRSIGAAARRLGVNASEAQRRCRALFARTGTDGREQLFELGLRLAAATELSRHLLTGSALR